MQPDSESIFFCTKAVIIYIISRKKDHGNSRLILPSVWLHGFSSHVVCACVAYELKNQRV